MKVSLNITLAAILALMLCSCFKVKKDGDLSGVYECDGGSYRGTTTITKVGNIYRMQWDLGGASHVGVAVRNGDILSSSWSAGGAPGIVVYKILGKKLAGSFSGYPGDGNLQGEVLTYIGQEGQTSAPGGSASEARWQVGDRALVNWTGDSYWYPATIGQVQGGRYYIHFDDGDKEWTDASRIMGDDIEVGDQVFSKPLRSSMYEPATVTSRNGLNVGLDYENGRKEETAIVRIRVVRPK